MWWYVGAAVVGALWMSNKAPETRYTKSQVVGARSGKKWRVEYLEDLGAKVVIHGGTRVVFRQTPNGWQYVRHVGHPQVVAIIRKDFESEQ